MGAWLTYFKERFPLVVYVILVGGMAASGTRLGHAEPWGLAFWLSFVGLMLFFSTLRLMDELKDYEKDCIAHPERPLPRGLLKREAVRKVVALSVGAMAVFGVAQAFLLPAAGFLYLFVTAYLWLMYREFYAAELLSRSPLFYAVTHQIILLPLCAFPVAAAGGDWKGVGLWYGTLVLGAFFSYEVSRKLDPKAHPILGYYRELYGPGGCLAIVGVCSIVAAWAACYLGVAPLTLPFLALVILSFALLPRGGHKIVEGAASLSLIAHIWAILLKGLL
jgi:hypothetical protein